MKIKRIRAYEILDSRGNPTVLARVILEDGTEAEAAVPSGASTGIHEAAELRDGDKTRFGGKGVLKAVGNIENQINEALAGRSCLRQRKIDEIMTKLDGTENKSRLGANAVLAVSTAVMKAAAKVQGMPVWKYAGGIYSYLMPLPMMNILNGGAHADNNIDIQEFMVMPSGAKTFAQGARMCAEIYAALKSILSENNLSTAVGDEGGFAPNLETEEEAIELIAEAISLAGYTAGDEVKIALDAAASEWYEDGVYRLPKKNTTLSGNELCDYWARLCERYPIISIEDGAAQDDFKTWKRLTRELSGSVQLVGDDLFVTDAQRLCMGIKEGMANAILIKPNQIGTVSETLDAIQLAKENGYGVVISHRSGETEDTFIADLAVGTNAGQIKSGAPCRSERTAKYNRLIRIEKELNC